MKALTGDQLRAIVRRDKKLNDRFLGVFAGNELPKHIPVGKALIVNCCSRHLPGMHWLALCRQSKSVLQFFDSFGEDPGTYKDLTMPESESILLNDRRLQSYTSEVCGYYCLYYCYFKARNETFSNIVNSFSNYDYIGNDYFVYDSVCNLFNTNILE